MNKINNKDIEYIKQQLINGKSIGKIAEELKVSKNSICYHVRKNKLNKYSDKCLQKANLLTNEFEKIDTPEKAYILGFILGDGHIANTKSTEIVSICISLKDKEIIEFIAKQLKANIKESLVFDRSKRLFPKASLMKKIPHIFKHLGGRLKPERHFPIVKQELYRYLILGLFDADGCVTFGHRKDRNRLWQSIKITHHLKCLVGLQQYLTKNLNISCTVRPKSSENAYVLEFSNSKNVLKFLSFIYDNSKLIVLKRKYEKYNALRLEMGELKES